MSKKTIALLVLVFITASGFAQVKFPYPVNTEANESNATILPDSSIILMSDRSEFRCYRFTYAENKWVSTPNSLTNQINGLLISKKNKMYDIKFSNDFNYVLLTMHIKRDYRIYESKKVGNEWSFFELILYKKNSSHNLLGLSYGSNHNIMYTNEPSTPNIIEYNRIEEGWKVADKIDLEKFNTQFIDQITRIGNGLLFVASFKSNEKLTWVYSKKLSSDEWSAPTKVGGISGFHLSFTSSGNNYIYYNHEGNVYIAESPQFLKNEIAKSRSAVKPEIEQPTSLISSTPSKSNFVKPTGNYYALLIGNSDYELDELDLDKPTQDVDELATILSTQYQFDSDKVVKLINSDRNSTLQALYNLRKTLTPEDNLLIFYAGHGYWDEQIGQGYWWPTDATQDNPANWLSNSDLREQIRGINTAHTLLISDACFSGGIFKTRGAEDIRKADRDIQLLYRMPSRRAITSGTLSTVPDKSVFFKYLIKYLSENDKKFISSSELFTTIRTSVLNNSLTVPQDGVILNTGDEGGDFIFIKK